MERAHEDYGCVPDAGKEKPMPLLSSTTKTAAAADHLRYGQRLRTVFEKKREKRAYKAD